MSSPLFPAFAPAVPSGGREESQRSQARQPLALSLLMLIPNGALLALYYLPNRKRLVGDEGYYYNLGRAFVEGANVAHNPLWPPLYGDLTGWFFKWFGVHPLSVQLMQMVMWYGCGWLVFLSIKRLTSKHNYGLAGMALFYLSPETAAFSHYLWPEIIHMALMLSAFYLLLVHTGSAARAALAGVCLGLAVSAKLLLGPFLPFCALLLWLNTPGDFRRKLTGIAALVGALVLVLTPTLLTNQERYGKAMIADSSIFNIWVGLNDVERRDDINDIAGHEFQTFQKSAPDIQTRNQIYRQKILDLVSERGLWTTLTQQLSTQYFRLLGHKTFLTTQLADGNRAAYQIQSKPVISLVLLYSHAYHLVLLGLLALGIAYLPFSCNKPYWFCALFLAYNAALFLLVHVKTRYMVQLIPIIIPFALLGLAEHEARIDKKRLPAAIVIWLGLVYLAFSA